MNFLKTPSALVSAISLIVLAWVLDFWVRPKPCFQSEFVAEMRWDDHHVPACNFEFLWSPRPRATREELTKAQQKLDSLSQWLNQFGPFVKQPKIVISSEHHQLRKIDGTNVYLGDSYVRADGQLERAWIEAWAHQKLSISRMQNDLSREMMIDVLLALYQGEFRLQHPITGEYASIDSRHPDGWIVPNAVISQHQPYGQIGNGQGRVQIKPLLLQKFINWYASLKAAQKARTTFLLAFFWQTTDWPSDLNSRQSQNISDGLILDKPGWEEFAAEIWDALVGHRFG